MTVRQATNVEVSGEGRSAATCSIGSGSARHRDEELESWVNTKIEGRFESDADLGFRSQHVVREHEKREHCDGRNAPWLDDPGRSPQSHARGTRRELRPSEHAPRPT